jgi:sugar lactone lactonase YvrE
MELELVADGLSFVESPRWRGGRLYVSDFFTHRVLSIGFDGSIVEVCQVPGQPSGTGFLPDGSLLVVSMLDRRVLRLDHGTLVEHADLSQLAPSHLNDMLVDSNGRAYVGNFGWDRDQDPSVRATVLLLVERNGRARVAADGLVFPNGMALDADGLTLFIAESYASRISAFDVADDGSLSNRRVWATLGDGTPATTFPEVFTAGLPVPDGIALDSEGAIWVADAAGRGAIRVGHGGEILDQIPTGALTVYAVGFAGDDRRTLVLCVAAPFLEANHRVERRASVLACRVAVPGVAGPT